AAATATAASPTSAAAATATAASPTSAAAATATAASPTSAAAAAASAAAAARAEPLALARALVDWANTQGGQDNISVALARIHPIAQRSTREEARRDG
ncbi:MAG: hypothetical protein ACYDC9_08335, partial [Dermatophilaceae bacterium]